MQVDTRRVGSLIICPAWGLESNPGDLLWCSLWHLACGGALVWWLRRSWATGRNHFVIPAINSIVRKIMGYVGYFIDSLYQSACVVLKRCLYLLQQNLHSSNSRAFLYVPWLWVLPSTPLWYGHTILLYQDTLNLSNLFISWWSAERIFHCACLSSTSGICANLHPCCHASVSSLFWWKSKNAMSSVEPHTFCLKV